MKFRIVVEYHPATKSYAAHCPELPGVAVPAILRKKL